MKRLEENLENIYSIKISGVKLIVDKGKKKVWQVFTPNGKKVLKILPISKGRADFIVRVSRHLISEGIKTPQIIPTTTGEGYYESYNEGIYLLTDWVNGSEPDFCYHLEYIVKALAKFHKCTRNFNIPSGKYVSYRRGTWIRSYQKRQRKLLEIKMCCLENNEVDRVYQQNIDYFLNKAHMAQKYLELSYYYQWLKKIDFEVNLCHQDFIPQNLMLNDDGEIYVFDLDTLTVDLPALDLRKLINNVCKKRGKWDTVLVKSIQFFYNSVNPLTSQQWEVVFIDLMYPHLFYSLVNNYCFPRVPGCLSKCNLKRLKKAIEYERSKDVFYSEYFGSKKYI